MIKKLSFVLFLLVLSALSIKAQIISTIAGNGGTGVSGDGGPATAAQTARAICVTQDIHGNIYFTEIDSNRIRKVTTAGIISTIAGTGIAGFSGDGGPSTAAQINWPFGIVTDRIGNIYFSDISNRRIRKIDTAGIITTVAGTGTGPYNGDGIPATAANIWYVQGLCLDDSGNLYMADHNQFRVRMMNSAGIISTVAGNGTLSGSSGDGGPATDAGFTPNMITKDRTGNLYIADHYNNNIRKINSSGIISTITGPGTGFSGDGGPVTAALINHPDGIQTDVTGNIYFADYSNHRIRKIDTSGIITTIAGSGPAGIGGFSGDGGPATSATLNGPWGIFRDSATGNIFIADNGNNRIRKISYPNPGALQINNIVSDQQDLVMFPNPGKGSITIQLSKAIKEEAHVTITDVAGRVVKGFTLKPFASLTLALGMPDGTYVVTATTSTGTWSKKLVIANE